MVERLCSKGRCPSRLKAIRRSHRYVRGGSQAGGQPCSEERIERGPRRKRYGVKTGLEYIIEPLPTSFSCAAHDSSGSDGGGLGKFFADPNLLGKLATNPRTAKHMADPSFRQKLELIQTNPALAEGLLSGDPRLIDVLGALMGIDMQGFSRPEGSDDLPPGVVPESAPKPTSPPPQKSPPPQTSSSKPPPPEPAKVEEDIEMEDENDEDVKAKREAEAEKKLGAEAYKKRDFEAAATHFSKAWDVWPKDVTFLTNLGGMKIFSLKF